MNKPRQPDAEYMTTFASAIRPGSIATDTLCPAAGSVSFAAPGDPWSFTAVAASERPAVERFISERFARAYGAHVTRYLPSIMVLRRGGTLLAACGLRAAERERLFLETYLDAPVESVLSAAIGAPVDRRTVIEVGNLAIARPGAARELIVRLTRCLYHAGRAWTVFSAVPTLRNNFARLGIRLTVLGPADGSRLPHAERAAWGTYYDACPMVAAVSVAEAHAALARTA